MNAWEDYKSGMLTLLGDENGRRFSDKCLQSGLRQALDVYGRYFPRVQYIRTEVKLDRAGKPRLPWTSENGGAILAAWKLSRDGTTAEDFTPLHGLKATYFTEYSELHGCAHLNLREGDKLKLAVECSHVIYGLEGAQSTSIEDELAPIILLGGAAFALEMRALSIVEVFGKRSEDFDNLMRASMARKEEFMDELSRLCLRAMEMQAPFPQKGFPI